MHSFFMNFSIPSTKKFNMFKYIYFLRVVFALPDRSNKRILKFVILSFFLVYWDFENSIFWPFLCFYTSLVKNEYWSFLHCRSPWNWPPVFSIRKNDDELHDDTGIQISSFLKLSFRMQLEMTHTLRMFLSCDSHA